MDKKIIESNSIIYSSGTALTFFWILNIFKESFNVVKDFLNFYPPVGPLLGLFLSSSLLFILCFVIIPTFKPINQKFSFIFLWVSAVVFCLMVFPPISELFIKLIKESG
ncbi:hypothetical protein HYW46_02185 [Candidatus Daviesbacteria bacterium]|nr:hypothetical protein [Candidatus Daviesbacteria bacterium]